MKKQLLVVNGYNMIGAWPELTQLKKQERLGDARELLLSCLSDYAKYKGVEVTVVFDAQLIPDIRQTHRKYLLTMVFTKEDEIADSYIERLAGEKDDRLAQVTAVMSDLAGQRAVFSQGALWALANELYKAVRKTGKTIAIHATGIHFR